MRRLALLGLTSLGLAVGTLCLATTPCAYAQTTTSPGTAEATAALQRLLNGTDVPTTLKLKELNAEWRRVSIAGQGDMNPFMMIFMPSQENVYYTRGQVIEVGTERFIVAYIPPTKKVDFMTMMRMGPGGQMPLADKLTPDTSLSLVLLNLRVVNMIGSITPFDMKAEIARREQDIAAARVVAQNTPLQPAQAQATNEAVNSQLKQLALAALQFAVEHGETMPFFGDAEKTKQLLMPYIKNEALFVHPRTGTPYEGNPALSQKKLAAIADVSTMVLFYEPEAAGDGTRGVAYADGHVKRVSEAEWPQIKKASRIP